VPAVAAVLLLGACDPSAQQGIDGGMKAPQADNEAARQSTVTTDWGPLGPADRDVIVQVRQAALWEIPVARQARRRAARPATRRALAEVARRHAGLDRLNRKVAGRLNVPLPDRPSPDQQSWMSEIAGKSGNDYDRFAVARMRMAQGLLYTELGAVRASTRNTLVRKFAEQAQPFVSAQMTQLETTGFVTGDTLPDPPAVTEPPPPAPRGAERSPAPAATSLLPRGAG
jgi:putative membrane protein